MIKKSVEYTDFNGEKRTEDFYFNLTEAECAELELSIEGRLSNMLTKIVNERNEAELIKMFKKIVLMSYGEKSDDGKYFFKNDDIRARFECSAAYSKIFMELATNTEAATKFVNGIVPNEVAKPQDHKPPQK